MRLMQKATPREYHGPRKTPEITLTTLWVGQQRVKPTGMDSVPPTTPTAVRMPASASDSVRLLSFVPCVIKKHLVSNE